MDDFTFVGVVKEKDSLLFLNSLYVLLQRVNFLPENTIFRLVYNVDDRDFEFAEFDEVDDGITDINSSEGSEGNIASVRKWDGWFCSFSREDMCLGIAYGKSDDNVCNCYVKIAARFVTMLLRMDDMIRLYRLLAQILKTGVSRIGIMDAGFEFPSLTEAEIVEGFLDSPVNPGFPVSVGLISQKLFGSGRLIQIRSKVQAGFTNTLLPEGYWVIEEHDFREVYSQLKDGKS